MSRESAQTSSNKDGASRRDDQNRSQDRSANNTTDDFDNMLNNIQEIVDKRNTYSFRECIQRNLVLLGRTRTGKSTVSKVLQNSLYIPDLGRLYAETRKISFNQIAAVHENRVCHFSVIDSPGLYDITLNAGERLTNENIKTFINDCITKDVTHIHVFAFVFSSDGGINSEDIKSMIFVQKKYPQLREFFILLITHCEEKNAEERDIFVEEFFKHPKVVENGLRAFFGLGVYFMGCLRPQLKRNPNTLAASIQIKNILEMRHTLLDFLVNQEKTFNIHYPVAPEPVPNPNVAPEPEPASTSSNIVPIVLVILAVLVVIFAIFIKE